MKIIISPNSFKGTISSIDACQIIERGISSISPRINLEKLPIADGGDGTLDFFKYYFSYKTISIESVNPLGEIINSEYILIENENIAVIEFANASGYNLMLNKEKKLQNMDSYGTGIQIKSAIEIGVKKIIISLGGSATIDGASGILRALGVKFFNNGKLIDKKNPITEVTDIDISNFLVNKSNIEFILLTDVNNKLLGDQGAVNVFGKQKGLLDKNFNIFEEYLYNFSSISSKVLGKDIISLKGGGSAGGAGGILSVFFNSKILNGTEFLLNKINYEKYLKNTDLVITGEGSIDSQSLNEKGPVALMKYIKKINSNIIRIAIGGRVDYSVNDKLGNYFDYIFSISDNKNNTHILEKSEYYLLEESKKIGKFLEHIKL